MLKASGYASLVQKGASQKELEAYAKDKGTTTEELEGRVKGMVGVVRKEWLVNRTAEAATEGVSGRRSFSP